MLAPCAGANQMLSKTTDKANENTPAGINGKISTNTETALAEHLAGGPKAIGRRLGEIEREWDIERALETTAATLTVTGVLLGAVVDRRWLILPAVVGGFMLQHTLQGWCPPLPIFRALGFRTAREIDEERYALKAARGDFVGLIGRKEAALLLEASRR